MSETGLEAGRTALSVVVVTRNRIDRLKRCIEALLAVNTAHEWELIVVDNGSSDGTAAYLSSLGQRVDAPPIRTLSAPIRGRCRGINIGWRAARSPLIAFTDDDCYVEPNFVDAILTAFDDQRVGFVCGRVLPFDPNDDPITTVTRESAVDVHPDTFISAGDMIGANMAFRTSTLTQIGGFDEDFGPGTRFNCDDTEAFARTVWHGFSGTFDPRIVVFHHHGRRGIEAVRLSREYAQGRGAYYAKMVLGPRSRRTYLRIWKVKAVEDLKAARTLNDRWRVFLVLSREFVGAAKYLIHSIWHPSKVPAP